MKPEVWYRTLPITTRLTFTANLLTALLALVYEPTIGLAALDWDRVAEGQVWRLLSNFLVWGPTIMAAYQIAILAHYSRCLELEAYPSHRGAFTYLLLLLSCISITIAASLYWPLRFGGPVVLFFILSIYSRSSPDASSSFFGLSLARRYLPAAHWSLLYILQTNYSLAGFGMLLGYSAVWLAPRLPALPEKVLAFGDRLQLGEAPKDWQVRRDPTQATRLGGVDTSRWTASS